MNKIRDECDKCHLLIKEILFWRKRYLEQCLFNHMSTIEECFLSTTSDEMIQKGPTQIYVDLYTNCVKNGRLKNE